MTPGRRIAKGERIYAIGDVHGRADLFAELFGLIRDDDAARPRARTRIVLLGDIIDRGPDSADLVDRLMRYTRSSRRFVVLRGNHEQVMLAALSGVPTAAEMWMKFGGDAALRSWGVPAELIAEATLSDLMWQARRTIPEDVLQWMRQLRLSYRSGDVLFVHAGIRPGVPLRRQTQVDLLGIRGAFVESDALHPLLIVHGHTISEDGPDVRPNRIGIDTGAYRTGRLTALGLQGDETWSLATGEDGPPDTSLRKADAGAGEL